MKTVVQQGDGTISACIIRADGRVEELGIIAKPPLRVRLKARLRRLSRRQ